MKGKLLPVFSLFFLVLSVSCKKNSTTEKKEIPPAGTTKAAPDGFNFVTSRQVSLNVRLLSTTNTPISGVVVSVIKPGTTAKTGLLFKAVSDKNGYIKGIAKVPSYIDTLVIEPNYPGLMNNAKALISSGIVTAVIGGPKGYSGAIVPQALPAATGNDSRVFFVDPSTGLEVNYPSPYTRSSEATVEKSGGVPVYLESERDRIEDEAMEYMNGAAPEGEDKTIKDLHPELLTSKGSTIDIKKKTNLYLTFVSEGTENKNALGYYTYPTGKPPATVSEVGKIQLILPNTSCAGSGGGLVAGDKVKIGPFDENTTVGFVVIQNAWTGSGVSVSKQKFFCNKELNPESKDELRRHSFIANVKDLGIYLFGFEDMNRETEASNPSGVKSDNDFNDVLFYITPGDGIDDKDCPILKEDADTDKDGVEDSKDQYPNDPERAFIETNAWNTLAFEDLWPNTGDYDMNDVVIQYRYHFVKNAANEVVEFTGEYNVVAAGAVYEDGFGVEFPIEASQVKKVTGYKFKHNYIGLDASGVEAGQKKAVIIPFDDYHAVINNSNSSLPIINTNPAFARVTGETLKVNVLLEKPVSADVLNPTAFNPFLIPSLQRKSEIHLSGMKPTEKADLKLLGSGNDESNAVTGKYYQTGKNWPWAIDIAGTFLHPIEGAAISNAYLHFLDWAQSGGSEYPDWYSNTEKGYRQLDLIFQL